MSATGGRAAEGHGSVRHDLLHDVDVIVVGFGGAGASAAIVAHDLGLQVAIVEVSELPGGNTRASGGSLRPVDDTSDALAYLEKLSVGETPTASLRAFLEATPSALAWLEAIGATLEPMDTSAIGGAFPRIRSVSYPGAGSGASLPARMRVRGVPGESGGESLWRVLETAVQDRDILVLSGTRAMRLVPGADGAWTLTCEGGGSSFDLNARRGVILATGGFGHDVPAVADYLGHPLSSFGPPSNRGDGVRLAQSAGAGLWHMAAYAVTLGYTDTTHDLPVRHQSPTAGFVYVDQAGRRFVNETETDFHALPMTFLKTDVRSGSYQRMPSYFVFDERTRLAGPIANRQLTFGTLSWSDDNSREVDAGVIVSGDTIESLAEELRIDVATFDETIAAYNRACVDGTADPLGRGEREPLLTPPYYAIAIEPVLVNTQGGPRRDDDGAVLDPDGRRIPGLYAAGELGSIWGHFYPGAGNLTEAIVSGRTAAQTIGRERT